MFLIFFLHKKCENPQIETPCCLKRREGIFLTERIGVRQNKGILSIRLRLAWQLNLKMMPANGHIKMDIFFILNYSKNMVSFFVFNQNNIQDTMFTRTSTTKVVLEAQCGTFSAPCLLHQYTVAFEWKCRLFCLCVPGQCRVHHIYYVEFHFRFRRLVSFPV